MPGFDGISGGNLDGISGRLGSAVPGGGNPAGPNCVLLLHCDGTQGSTTFADSSGRGHVLTATNGGTGTNPYIDTAHPKFGTGAYIDNNGYLTLDGVTDFTFGTADFTIDCWVYLTAAPASQARVISFTDASGSWANHPALFIDAGLHVAYFNSSGAWITSTSLVTLNTWTHLAWVRASGTISIYVNGVFDVSASETGSLSPLDPTGPSIGGQIGLSSYNLDTGYLDELRILNGRAAWTASFTPPTAPYTDPPLQAGPNCVLLCHFDGVDGSTAFVDSSGKNHVFTSVLGASLTSAQAKFGATSFGKFPALAGYWTGDDSSDFNFGTGDFTVDFWMYQAAFGAMGLFTTGPDPAFRPDVNAAGSGTVRYVNTNSGGAIITSPVVIGLNSWHHIAFVRASAVAYLFVDGVLQGTAADTGNIVLGASPEPEIGAWTNGYYVTNSAIDELRVLKGRAAWTSNFTPPTTPYTDPPPLVNLAGPNCVLLLHMDGTSGSTSFTDSSASGHAVTAHGPDLHIDAGNVKFGNGAALYGSAVDNNVLTVDGSTNFAFGTGDFTVDMWVYITTRANASALYSSADGASTRFGLLVLTDGTVDYYSTGVGPTVSTTTVPLNTWTHLAVTRASNTVRVFMNGTQVITLTDANNYPIVPGYPAIGAQDASGATQVMGAIDEVRVLKGQAAWTANFTPPTTPYT